MRILVAENINGAWQKVAVLRVGYKSGSYNVPAKMSGQLSARAAIAAINQFRADSAAQEIIWEWNAYAFRCTRF
jgi:hypothetical protein